MIPWAELIGPPPEESPDAKEHLPTAKCDLCGRFTKTLTLVWTGGPEPEPDYSVGDCCREGRK